MGETFLAWSSDFAHWKTVGDVKLALPSGISPYEDYVALTNYPTVQHGPISQDVSLFAAGKLTSRNGWNAAIGETAFLRSNLRAPAATLRLPLLYPQAPYESYGLAPQTVVMNSVVFYRNRWWMYYSAGGSVVAVARATLRTAH